MRKGQLGNLQVAVISILAIAILLSFGSLVMINMRDNQLTITNVGVINQSIVTNTSSPTQLSGVHADFGIVNGSESLTKRNATGTDAGGLLNVTFTHGTDYQINYSSGRIIWINGSAVGSNYNNTLVNVSFSYRSPQYNAGYNASISGLAALDTIGDNLATIVLMIIAVVVIGLLLKTMGGRGRS